MPVATVGGGAHSLPQAEEQHSCRNWPIIPTKLCERLYRLMASLYSCQASGLALRDGFLTRDTSSKRMGNPRVLTGARRYVGTNREACKKLSGHQANQLEALRMDRPHRHLLQPSPCRTSNRRTVSSTSRQVISRSSSSSSKCLRAPSSWPVPMDQKHATPSSPCSSVLAAFHRGRPCLSYS